MATATTRTQTRSRNRQSKAHRLKSGAKQGHLVRVYQDHQMRFARAVEVDSGIGFGPNVLVQYLDGDEEQEKIYGNIVQPVDGTWLQTMTTRLAGLESEFTDQITSTPEKGQRVNHRQRLKCGVKAGSLVRVYREHHVRFGYAIRIDTGLGLGPNVTVRYLDTEPTDKPEIKVYGNIVQPVDKSWLEDMKARVHQLEKAFEAEQADSLN